MGTASFYFADATFWLQPMAQYLYESVRQGRFPLWNPLCYCGMPQLAITFPNLLYPPDLLFVLFPFNTALGLSMVFHQTLAAVGMYLLVRGMREPPPSAMVAALIYSLSGYMFALPSNHSLVAGAAWFVFAFWTIRHLEFVPFQKLPLQTLYGALSICMLFASGRPEIFVPSYLLIAAYVVRNFVRRKPNTNNCLFWQIRVLFLGVCFALPTLLPTFEWLSMSRRALGLQTFEVFLNSAGWYDIVSTIIGQALGDLRLHGAPFRPLISPVNIPPYLSCAFVGGVAFTLAIWGMAAREWKIKWTLLLLLVVTTLISMGNNTPLMPRLVETFPALGFIRFPVKILFLVVFLISIFAARGTTLLKQNGAAVRLTFAVWGFSIVTAIVWILAAERGVALMQFSGFHKTAILVLAAQRNIGFALILAALVGIAVAMLGVLAKRSSINYQTTSTLTVSLLYATLFIHAVDFEKMSASADYYQRPSVSRERVVASQRSGINPNSRVLNLCLELLTVPKFYLGGSQEDRTAATFQYDREVLIPNTHMNFNMPSSYGFEGTMKGDYFHTLLYAYFQSNLSLHPSIDPPSDSAIACFSKITNTGFVITQVERKKKTGEMTQVLPLDSRLFTIVFEDKTRNIRIYQVKDVLPRAYLSHAWRNASHNQALSSVLNPEVNGFFPEKVTLIEDGPIPLLAQNGAQSQSNDIVELVQEVPELLTVRCETDEPSLLVIADQMYPGWTATIDGSPAISFTANAFNRAVFVPPGRHMISFEYHPSTLVLGLSLAGLSCLLWVYLAWKHKGELTE